MKTIYDSKSFFKSYFVNATEKNDCSELISKKLFLDKGVENIVDLGSHDGEFLKKIIHVNPHHFEACTMTGVDPADVRDKFYRNIKPLTKKTIYFKNTIEDFFKQNIEKYDVIIASQSLYWCDNLSDIIHQIGYRGKSSAIILRGENGIYAIQNKFKALLGNANEKLYTSKDVENAIQKNKLSFEKHHIESRIQLPERNSDIIDSMLSFFLQRHSDTLSDTEKNTVLDFIYDELSVDHHYIIHDVDVFFLGECVHDQ